MRLLRDTRGNALAIMAAMLIPLTAITGSAVDMGRLYAVKSRLQQACDAGVLAGRKAMTGTTLDTSDGGPAQTFFKNNFQAGWFGTSNVTFQPSLTSDYQVAGRAQATVPMTLMTMFGSKNRTLTLTCQARYDVADADIMFVLDTTGSMACTTADDNGNGCGAQVASYTRPDGTTGYYNVEENGSKISGLRSAILSFYDAIQSSADTSTHIRYGFVPYTSTVNAGYLLATANLVTKWNYQTRTLVGDYNLGSSTSMTSYNVNQNNCNNNAGRSPTSGYGSNGRATVTTVSWTAGTGSSAPGTCVITKQTVRPLWTYGQAPLDISQFIKGNTVDDPTKITAATSKWQGCLEERRTTVAASFDASNLPPDLDPDLAPAANVDGNGMPTNLDTRWRPMWPDVIYYRGSSMSAFNDTDNTSNNGSVAGDNPNYPSWGSATYLSAGYATCGKPAQRLAVMTRDQVNSYVNASDFKAIGGTYHDTGMIWGTRLLSPSGLFQNDTAPWPGRQAPNRYIVFMTDGQMSPNQYIYGMYGMENYDKRVTGGTYANDTDYHNARFVAECQAAKNRNITVFVVGFGQTLNDQLKACASPGQAYYASDNAALTAAFQKIAAQVAMLRISK